jgi:hypothetical protein
MTMTSGADKKSSIGQDFFAYCYNTVTMGNCFGKVDESVGKKLEETVQDDEKPEAVRTMAMQALKVLGIRDHRTRIAELSSEIKTLESEVGTLQADIDKTESTETVYCETMMRTMSADERMRFLTDRKTYWLQSIRPLTDPKKKELREKRIAIATKTAEKNKEEISVGLLQTSRTSTSTGKKMTPIQAAMYRSLKKYHPEERQPCLLDDEDTIQEEYLRMVGAPDSSTSDQETGEMSNDQYFMEFAGKINTTNSRPVPAAWGSRDTPRREAVHLV